MPIDYNIFQSNIIQEGIAQGVAVVIATVLLFRSLATTTKLPPTLTTSIKLAEGDFNG